MKILSVLHFHRIIKNNDVYLVTFLNHMNIHYRETYNSEQDLWQAFLSSDKNAFACLFENYADAMYAYGCKMTPDRELVKDVIQDVFVKLYNNRQNLRDNVSIKAYLFTAVKRTLLNVFQAQRNLSINNAENIQFELEQISMDSYDDGSSKYDDEVRQQLAKALEQLSPRQKEAIYLYYIQEIPLNEIPLLLEMNYQSTRNLIHRAITKLREYMAPTSSVSMYALLAQYLAK